MGVRFHPGRNIALKVPAHEFDAAVSFYRDLLGLARCPDPDGNQVFEFGDKRLWVDRVTTLSQAEIWLEVVTDDLAAAAEQLKQAGVTRCDRIEPLPQDFNGFWISAPGNIIHLLTSTDESN